MDLPPVLIALGAQVSVVGPKGERRIAVEDLFAGYYETVLEKNELISEVHVPAQGGARRLLQGHHRLGRRLAGARRRGRGRAGRPVLKSARVVVSAATEKATRLKGAEAVLAGEPVDDQAFKRAGDAAADEVEFIADVRGSVPYKRELMRVYVGRAVRQALDGGGVRTDGRAGAHGQPQAGRQVGRSVPRLEAREKVTGRAEYTHTMRLPGMLHAKIFRSTVAHGRIKSIDTSAAQKLPGVHRVVTSTTCSRSFPSPITARRSTTSRSWRSTRCASSASRSPPCSPAIRMSPRRRRSSSSPNTRSCRRSSTRSRRRRPRAYVHDELKPAGTFADLKHLKGRKDTNVALDFRLRRGDVDKAHSPPPRTCSSTSSGPRRCCTWRSSRIASIARLQGQRRHHLQRVAGTVVRAHRDRAAARLAGETSVRIKVPYLGGGFGAKLYIKLEALALALSMIARRPVKVALTMEEMFLPDHQAPQHVPHQERRRQGRPDHRAQVRGVTGTAAPMPTSARA